MADNLKYKTEYECLVIVKDFINNVYSGVSGSPIEDPYASATSNSRNIFAQIEDEDLSIARFPKITVSSIDGGSRDRIGGGKTEYRERFDYDLSIMYVCSKSHIWNKDGIKFKGTHQCKRYLQYLGDQLKKYSDKFDEFNQLVIGSVSNVGISADTLQYKAVLPIKVSSYGRV